MNRIAVVISIAALPVFTAACPPVDDTPPDTTIEPACTEPTTVDCVDQLEQNLSMDANNVTAGAVTAADAGGKFHAHIDASVGSVDGFGAKGYVYAKFTDTGLKRVEISDDASFTSMDWDIAFHRFVIRANSGTSGPSCVTVARAGAGTTFDDANVDDSLTFNAEQFMGPSPTCDFIDD